MLNISVLGCGRWGSFIAWYLASQKGYNVYSWGPEDDYSYQVLKNTGKNEYVQLDSRITLTCDLQKAVDHAEIIIISISSQGLRGFMDKINACGAKNKTFVLCMKGIEVETGKRLSEILIEKGIDKNKIAVWVGPGHIQDFTAGIPNCMVIDSYDENLKKYLADNFKTSLIRYYYGNDIIGTEIGAAAKNVMGIAAGLLDGMGYSTLKGGLMARGTREISRLIKACGGKEMSAYGLCHLGDYEATLFSEYSHNRKWGESFAQDKPFDKLAEGVDTSSALLTLAESINVELPITQIVNDVINNRITKKEAIKQLFKRENIKEF